MRKLLFVVPFLMLVPLATGADVFKATLTSTDGGSSQTVSLSTRLQYALQCKNPACYKTGTATTLTADCTQDFLLDDRSTMTGTEATTTLLTDGGTSTTASTTTTTLRTPARHLREFESGSSTKIVAAALDAGDPACNLYLKTFTPPAIQ